MKKFVEKQDVKSEEFLKKTEEAPSLFIVEEDLKPQQALKPVTTGSTEVPAAKS